MSEDTRTLQQLAQESYDVQNACNLMGVTSGYHRALCRLRTLLPTLGGKELYRHPISVLWADKVAHLAGTQFADMDYVSKAYDKVLEWMMPVKCSTDPGTGDIFVCNSLTCPVHGQINKDLAGV